MTTSHTSSASRVSSGPGGVPRGELVAGGGRLDQPPDQPAAAKRERWEHVRATIAPHPGLGRGLVVRLLLRKTPYPFRHSNLRGEATSAAGGEHAFMGMPLRGCDQPRASSCRASKTARRPTAPSCGSLRASESGDGVNAAAEQAERRSRLSAVADEPNCESNAARPKRLLILGDSRAAYMAWLGEHDIRAGRTPPRRRR